MLRSASRMSLGADQLFFRLVVLLRRARNSFSSICSAVHAGEVCWFDAHAELRQHVGLQAGEIPLVGTRIFGAAPVDDAADDAARHLDDALFLFDAFEQLAAHAVDGLALLVHDVVVLEQVFAGFEVLRFDGLLRGRDALGDQAGLDRHILFHAEPQHEVLHALAAEDAQQIVLQREIEARTAGIALAAGAAAQLVIDAARIVALGADDVQAAERDHFIVLLVGTAALDFGQDCVLPSRLLMNASAVGILPCFAQASRAPWIRGCRRAECRCRGRPCWWKR